ncbi:MAG: hypothetical protein ACI9VT_001299 [Psychroserpens sp.]|jgi:hypothetical protein
MAKKNNRLIYFILAVVAYLIMKPLYDEEIISTQKTDLKQNYIKKPELFKSDIKLSKKLKTSTKNQVYTSYKVKADYPTQDVFDEHICTIDKLHTDYKSSFIKAIKRLDGRYQHHNYKANDYLEINLYVTKMTKFFEQKLIERINILHHEYIKLLGESAKRNINLNLVITPDREDYVHYSSFYSFNPTQSLGVYFGGLNIAYVDYQNSDNKALKTALHETVHALNANIIGRTPRMFNEGMAEFYENMSIKEGNIEIIFSKNQLTREPLPLMQFFDYLQWSSLDIHHLYYSSWAWVTFMFGDKDRIKSLISFMKKEQVDPCSAFTAGESYEIFQEDYSMLEPEFYFWQQNMNSR